MKFEKHTDQEDIYRVSDLPDEWVEDIEGALRVRHNAHAPFSGYAVGAVLRSSVGEPVVGWNFETANYHGICAERAAAVRLLPNQRVAGLTRVTVAGGRLDGKLTKPSPPCGDCRQALLEVVDEESLPFVVCSDVRDRVGDCLVQVFDYDYLLPSRFSSRTMGLT